MIKVISIKLIELLVKAKDSPIVQAEGNKAWNFSK